MKAWFEGRRILGERVLCCANEKLLHKLADVPTPSAQTPRQLDSTRM